MPVYAIYDIDPDGTPEERRLFPEDYVAIATLDEESAKYAMLSFVKCHPELAAIYLTNGTQLYAKEVN